MEPSDRTASLMTPAKLAQVAARPPASPTAYLDRMAADVGHQHVRRLLELRQVLEAAARSARGASVQSRVAEVLPQLAAIDPDLLQPRGWLAGLTGKSRSAGSAFAVQVTQADEALQALATQAGQVVRTHQAQAAATDRALLEFDLEYTALDKVIDQGARWLQDMRNQLKAREVQAELDPDARRQFDEDTARCEVLVVRLKALRAAAAASHEARQEVRLLAERRTALAQGVQDVLATQGAEWRAKLPPTAAAAAQGRLPADAEAVKQANKALRRRLKQLLADCEQLATHEAGLGAKLDAMAEQLGAAS